MAEFVVDFGNLGKPAQADGRLDAPAFHRNHEPIWSAISGFLLGQSGDILEIGSGTGQHAATYAQRTPQLTWWPSDLLPTHLASIAGWRAHSRLENLRAPQRIDLNDPDWAWAEGPKSLIAVLCINVLHISPWRVSENLFAGTGRYLHEGGRLFVYGPFKRDGAHTAPSNQRFDATLRAENPEWGVRDVADLNVLARKAGLAAATVTETPANNLVLSFSHNRSNL